LAFHPWRIAWFRALFAVLVVLGLSCSASSVGAQTVQPGFAVNRFSPSERGSDWFVLESLDFRGTVRPSIGIVGDYSYKPLVAYDENGNEVDAVIHHQLYAHVGASLVLWERLRIGFDLPILLYQQTTSGYYGGDLTFADTSAQGIGDLRLGLDIRLFGAYRGPASLAIGAQVYLPTGNQQDFTGDGKVRVDPRLMFAGDASILAYAVKAGVTYRAQDQSFAGTKLGSEMSWAASLGLRLADKRLLIGPELYGTTTLEDPFAKKTTPTEVLIGAHYDIGKAWRLGGGVGPGVTRGVGTPEFRAVASLDWFSPIEEPPPKPLPPSDRDGDKILDKDDACPDVKGIANDDPAKNGCPPPKDRDGDGIVDPEDACPDVKGVKSDDLEKNGCPPDRDGDGILDDDDACPDEKGEKNEDPKKNGCPPPKDTDGDGIIDPEDACVDTPGPRNEDPKKNGCPAARIEKGQIRILEQVKFATNSDRILPESDGILSAVSKIFDEHAEITKVSIEGHTDNRGAAAHNKKLSDKRAASVVKWLIKRGIAKTRLTSQGFGMSQPIDSNDTDEGRQANRRVEFHILEIDGKPADSNAR
jgi:outer membrane protein OmpA-like peptidoglycan-associated protein